MKKFSMASLILGAIFLFSCNGNSDSNSMNSDSTNTTMSADTPKLMSSDTSQVTMVGDDAKDFSKEAAQGGMMEVQLGQLAITNGQSDAVKGFGKMMVDDHSQANNQLKELAAKKNVNLPTSVTEDQQKEIDKLSKKTGKDFDKDYVKMMVSDHKKDIEAFKKAGDKISDADYKNFIQNTLPTLQKHLDAIQKIDKDM